jgi:inositol phosphorylceramide synthase catalytic subunit
LHGLELRKRWLDVASFGLFLLVSFAAVYLNHHYVLDVLLGVLYTLAAWGVDRALEGRRRRRAAAPAPAAA